MPLPCKFWQFQQDGLHGWCKHPDAAPGEPCILNSGEVCVLREEFMTTIQVSYRNRDRLRAVASSMNLAVEKLLDDAGRGPGRGIEGRCYRQRACCPITMIWRRPDG